MRPDVEVLLSMPTFGECSELTNAASVNFETHSHQYMRYVHGYQVFLKPLHTFFTIDTVRMIVCGITIFMMAMLFMILQKQLNQAYAAVILLSFFITQSSSVFLLVTHAAQFWLVLAGASLAVGLRKRASPLFLFGMIGACDAFFTFLSMGSLSLGLPLLCYTLALWKDGRATEEIIAALFWGSVGWSIGFVVSWLVKWTVLGLVLHPAKEQLFGVTLDVYPTTVVWMIVIALRRNLRALHWILGLAIFVLLIIRKYRQRPVIPSGLWVVLFPALVPIVWVCILPGQSGIVHAFFINVILWPCLAAITLMLLAMPKPGREQGRL
jgi:hypothetical protein